MANDFDRLGLKKEADSVDLLIKKVASSSEENLYKILSTKMPSDLDISLDKGMGSNSRGRVPKRDWESEFSSYKKYDVPISTKSPYKTPELATPDWVTFG